MKKVISFVLTMALIFTSTVIAFGFEDIPEIDDDLTEAIDLLIALNIINGYEDGSLKLEKVVTRAEMVKMLMVAAGHGDNILGKKATFTDTAGHWAEGYISLANDLDIIEGTGTGTFNPDGAVTYEQAAAMNLRTMGYTNSNLSGGKSSTYDSSLYKSRALELGLFNGLGIDAAQGGADAGTSGTAILNINMKQEGTRGDMVLMTQTTLLTPKVTTGADGKPVQLTGTDGKSPVFLIESLAEKTNTDLSKFDITKDFKVTWQTPVVEPKKSSSNKLIDKIAEVESNYQVTVDDLAAGHSVDLSNYLYQNITVYKNAFGKIVYIVKSNVKTYTGMRVPSSTPGTITLETKEGSVALELPETNIPVFYNGAEESFTVATLTDLAGEMTVVADITDKKAVGIVYERWNPAQFVKAAYRNESKTFEGYNLPVKGDAVDFSKIYVSGIATSLSEIAKGDVIEVCQSLDESVIKFMVTAETIEGQVTKVSNGKYYINGEVWEATTDLQIGDEGIFYLDSKGRIFAFKEVEAYDTTVYGILTDEKLTGSLGEDPSDSSKLTIAQYPKLKIVDMDGKPQTLDVVVKVSGETITAGTGFVTSAGSISGAAFTIGYVEAIEKAATINGSSEDKLVKYTLNRDGKIDAIEAVTLTAGNMTVTDAAFKADGDTKILNYSTDAGDGKNPYSAVTVEDLMPYELPFQYAGTASAWDVLIVRDGVEL